jgi:hypothetical protein
MACHLSSRRVPSKGQSEMFPAARLTMALAMMFAAASPSAAGSPFPYCYIDYDGLRSCSFRTLQDCYRIRVGTGMCVTNPLFGVAPSKPQRRGG